MGLFTNRYAAEYKQTHAQQRIQAIPNDGSTTANSRIWNCSPHWYDAIDSELGCDWETLFIKKHITDKA